jgi:hypothetical protein
MRQGVCRLARSSWSRRRNSIGSKGLLSLALLILAGCSTVETRIKENPAAYSSLAPADQQLVGTGRIREGLPRSAIYIAWGRPDQVRRGSRKGDPFEAWVYTTIRQVYVGGWYPRFYRYGWYPYYGYWPFFHDPFIDDWVPIEVPYKSVFFERGRCTGWEYIE